MRKYMQSLTNSDYSRFDNFRLYIQLCNKQKFSDSNLISLLLAVIITKLDEFSERSQP